MYEIILSALIAICASINVSAQGTSPAAKGVVTSPQDPKAPSAKSQTGSEDNQIKTKLTNSAFIEKAAMMELTASAVSRMALRKGTIKATRDFAEMMVKSLQTMNSQLVAAAIPSGTAVPDKPDRAYSEAVSKLAVISGSDFDQNYIALMRQELDAMVSLFENAAGEQSLNEELRNFATKQLDTVRDQQLLAHNLVAS